MRGNITIEWEAEDGFGGGARPQSFQIEPEDFFGLTEAQLERAIDEAVREDFESKVSYSFDIKEVMEQIKQAEREAEARGEDEEDAALRDG